MDIGSVGRGELIENPEQLLFKAAPSRARRLVREGDILLSTVRTYLRAVWPVDSRADQLVASTGFAVLGPGPSIHARYLAWWAQSDHCIEEIVARSVGVSYPAINPDEIGLIGVPALPFEEQQAIADYLDTETARIDALICRKQKLAAALDERKSSIRDAQFRAAPGWRLKHLLAAPMAYGVLVPRFVDPGDGALMLRINAIDDEGRLDLAKGAWIEARQSDEYQRTRLAAGDLVLSVVGSMGRCAVVPPAAAGANTNRPLARVQPVDQLPSALLWHWTQTTPVH